MISCARFVSIALTFVIVGVSAITPVARADKIKTPPPKDASQKGQACEVNTKMKTAEKAFCVWDNFVRGRVVNPKIENTNSAAPSNRKLGQ
jgi:hypothetical protein